MDLNRRGLCSLALGSLLIPRSALAAGAQDLPSDLPSAGYKDFVVYTPDAFKTPAIRAGVVSPRTPYHFAVSSAWREAKLANALTGGFCMPNCGEPWTEIQLENPKEGKLQLLVTDLRKITNNPKATLKDIGTPQQVIPQIGPYVVGGGSLEVEDVLSEEVVAEDDGLAYYQYESYSPYGLQPPHALFRFAIKGGNAYLFIVNATDKQWVKSEPDLRYILRSFRA